ncbi:MAG: sporulation protein YqfD [Clostridia bacterium]|nr:sporulation protein YqfD [Clostridia bacterium]
MLLLKLWSFISGTITLVVQGTGLEKFINMAVSRGIHLWDITRIGPDRMRVKVGLGGFWPLRHISKRVNCRIHVEGKRGMPFIFSRLKRRRMLGLGAVTFLITLFVFSSLVWSIEVTGAKKIQPGRILEAAREGGLKPGTAKWQVDTEILEKNIRREIPELAFVGIEIRGTRVIIDVAEKKFANPQDKRPAHIVAVKKGIIKDVLVVAGQPMVKEGEQVEKGQVLISGVVTPEVSHEVYGQEELVPAPIPEVKHVRAQGIVRARTWYKGYGERKIVNTGVKESGRKVERLSIKIGGKEIILKGPQKASFKQHRQKVESKTIANWRNIKIPVEVLNTVFYELVPFREDVGQDGARKLAEDQAMAYIKKKIGSDARIIDRQVVEVATGDENLVRVSITIEAVENIGVNKVIR